jgi:hypothetical protein
MVNEVVYFRRKAALYRRGEARREIDVYVKER